MLSFLREQDSQSSEPTAAAGSNADTSAESKPQQQSQQSYLTVKHHQKQVFKGTILLAGLFVAGLLCLLMMIKKTGPVSAAAADKSNVEEARIEAAITRFTSAKSDMFEKTDEMIKKLQDLSEVQQVRTAELIKNPFCLERFWANDESSVLDKTENTNNVDDMKLLSIMQLDDGHGHCCMIDDKILHQGDSIRGFEISQITDKYVKLRKQELEIVLRLLE